MSSCRSLAGALAAALALATAGAAVAAPAPAAAPAQATAAFPGIGRAATPKELAAWDIDVRPDFKGLPPGSGSVEKGMAIWEGKCASCHGVFGESNQVFSPLVGGTTAEDIRSGRVARLNDRAYPGRTTLMKLSQISTLWDYIRRAMPWTQPKSLQPDEVYAVTAYLLNLGGIVPDDFTLSDRNMAEVQQRLPNRLGMTTDHGLWPGRGIGNGGKPDVKAPACMRDCPTEAKVASMLPDHARNAHGNLAQQNRLVGSQVGVDTARPAGGTTHESARAAAPAAASAAASTASTAGTAAVSSTAGAASASPAGGAPLALLNRNGCVACHGVDSKIVGPAFSEVAKRYAARADAGDYLSAKIRAGGSGVWGAVPMPPQTLPEADAKAIAGWLAQGAGK